MILRRLPLACLLGCQFIFNLVFFARRILKKFFQVITWMINIL